MKWLLVLVIAAGAVDAGLAGAQGNISQIGEGYPVGQLSTRDLGSGGAFGEIDAQSPINPAALGSWGTIGLHFQYDPEFRTLTAGGVTERTTTNRFPLFIGAIPIGHFTVGLSFSTLLDATWQTNTTVPLPNEPTDTGAQSLTTTVRSTGGINDLRFGVAWNVTPWLTVGGAMDWFTGENQISYLSLASDTTNNVYHPSLYQNTTSYGGVGASGGIILRPIKSLMLAGSFRVGGNIRARLNDSSTVFNGNVPARAGGGIAFTGIPGVTIGGRVDWEQWAQLNNFTQSGLLAQNGFVANDGVGWSVGTDVQGPRVFEHVIDLRLGGGRRPLPYASDGIQIYETNLSGGLGIPFGKNRVTIDVSVQRDWRTSILGVTENAYIVSTGLTIHP
jgi:hypothetical protein